MLCVLCDVKDEKASLTVNSSCRGAVSAEGVDRNGRVCRPKRSKNNDSEPFVSVPAAVVVQLSVFVAKGRC